MDLSAQRTILVHQQIAFLVPGGFFKAFNHRSI
jgi:hypothetical protein